MSIAIPQQVAAGKNDPSYIYARITNKNVYRLNTQCNPAQVATLIAAIKEAGKIYLKHWTKVEKRAPRTASLSPERPLMGSDPIAPRFRILDAFKLKCNAATLEQLVELLETKRAKAVRYQAALAAFDKTGDASSDSWWEDRDRIQRVLDCVEAERDYAQSLAVKEEFQV